MATARPLQGFSFDRVVGESTELRRAIQLARVVAHARHSTVLLIGETGTGKELFARGIHCEGPSESAPFVAVKCAAIPDTLLESELFGHEAGAFTGATLRKHGLMEIAGCGTLFLDEIHQLPMNLQPKLLRALEDRRVRRLGGTQEISIDCRLIAAANVSLDRAIDAGEFRADLYYRLNVLRVEIPTLRQRVSDIEILGKHFLAELMRDQPRKKTLADDAVQLLRGHAWPGNVRELKNVIERAMVVSGDEPEVRAHHVFLQRRVSRTPAQHGSGAAVVGEIEMPDTGKTLAEIAQEAVQLTLRITKGNRTQAAKLLGISRPTLQRIMRETPMANVAIDEAS